MDKTITRRCIYLAPGLHNYYNINIYYKLKLLYINDLLLAESGNYTVVIVSLSVTELLVTPVIKPRQLADPHRQIKGSI